MELKREGKRSTSGKLEISDNSKSERGKRVYSAAISSKDTPPTNV